MKKWNTFIAAVQLIGCVLLLLLSVIEAAAQLNSVWHNERMTTQEQVIFTVFCALLVTTCAYGVKVTNNEYEQARKDNEQ